MNAILEKPRLRIGVMPLADAAPVIVALAQGYFARRGLDVEIARERAWAAVRDKLAAGLLDAAPLLAPMPLAATLGLDAVPVPMETSLVLNRNGNAIVVSTTLHQRLLAEWGSRQDAASGSAAQTPALDWAHALRRVIAADQASGRPPLVFAHVYPFSTHHYDLRYWLAAGGIRPDHDLNLIVVPPSQMVAQLEAGRIDGYCVGAPWGEVAEHFQVGRRIVSKFEIWNNGPEKVLGVTRAWAEAHPATHDALITALIEAGRWLDETPRHRLQAARWLAEGAYLDAPLSCIEKALAMPAPQRGTGPGLVFHDGAAGFPWVSQARWYLRQMLRWQGRAVEHEHLAAAATVFRPDRYRRAAASLGIAAPALDLKSEGVHHHAWSLDDGDSAIGLHADRFLDDRVFEES